jgi:DNA repair protein RecO (recombination protein O)
MSQPRQATAFILRRVNFGDQDLIVTVLGRETGKFSALARSARASKKRFGGGLQPMRRLRLTYTHQANRNMAFLREIDVLEDFAELEASFEKITVASYATELVREIVQEAHAEPETFDLLDALYADLARVSSTDEASQVLSALQAVLFQFELRLLDIHGALPSLDLCFRCGAAADAMDKFRFMRSGEGLICADCRRAGEAVGVVSQATMDLICYLRYPDSEAPAGLGDIDAHQQIRRVLDASFQQMLDRPLKSRAMLDAIFL